MGGELSISNTDQEYKELSSMLNVLGNTTALKIFHEAAEGFKSGNETINKLGLTHRKYYRYLKKLNELEIITSSGESYHLTPLGKNLHHLVFNDALSLLSMDLEMLEAYPRIGEVGQIAIIDDYKDLVKVMIDAIEQSKSEILLASRYVDLTVTQSLVYALQRGVKLKSISNKRLDLSSLFKLLSKIVRDVRPNFITAYLSNTDNKVGDVPMSFILIDNKISIFELPNNEFKIAFNTIDKRTVRLLNDLFWEIWERSKKLKIKLSKT